MRESSIIFSKTGSHMTSRQTILTGCTKLISGSPTCLRFLYTRERERARERERGNWAFFSFETFSCMQVKVEFVPTKAPCDPRWMLNGRQNPGNATDLFFIGSCGENVFVVIINGCIDLMIVCWKLYYVFNKSFEIYKLYCFRLQEFLAERFLWPQIFPWNPTTLGPDSGHW